MLQPDAPYGLWLGWAYLTIKHTRLGVEGLTSIPLFCFVLVLCKIPQADPKYPRATFAFRKKLEVIYTNAFLGPGLAVVTSLPYTKT
jgi:hypothetical protein